MRIRSGLLATLCVGGLTQATWAHPGHSVEAGSNNSLLHYVTHPDHLAQWIVVVACAILAVVLARSVKRLAPAYARARKDKQS